jgi:hypothetical protein
LHLHVYCYIGAQYNERCFYNSSFLHVQHLFIMCNVPIIIYVIFFAFTVHRYHSSVNNFPYSDLSLSYHTLVLRNSLENLVKVYVPKDRRFHQPKIRTGNVILQILHTCKSESICIQSFELSPSLILTTNMSFSAVIYSVLLWILALCFV